ncbi:MAG: PTS system mannose/fructose/sorbose family transporter subunit IID [bacterium]|nr:PTS system mannose/fructose/sorbose family transporter subunit IID [bacterium]
MLSNWDVVKLFFRSLLVMAVFNFERMQNVGFAFTIFPIIKRLYPDAQSQKEAMLRHLEYINTNPYLVSSIAGIIISKEEELSKRKEGLTPGDISVLKSLLSAPLAGLGDALFWATYRPLISLIGVILILILMFEGKSILWGVGGFLIIYNLVCQSVRFIGLKKGYLLKEQFVEEINKIPVQKIRYRLNTTGMIFLGALSSVFCWLGSELIKIRMPEGIVWLASIMLILGVGSAIRIRINTLVIFLIVIGLGILLVYLKTAGMWDYEVIMNYEL